MRTLAAARTHRSVTAALCAAGALLLFAGCTSAKTGSTGSTGSTDTGSNVVTSPASVGASGDTSTATTGSSSTPSIGSSGTASATASKTPSHASSSAVVPAPGGGNIHQTVASQAVTTRSPVKLAQPARFGNKITVRAVRVAGINATAHGPGEIGGPAVEVTLRFINSSTRKVYLGNTVVNVTGDSGVPGLPIDGSPARPVTGNLAPHMSAVGRYVFTLAKSERAPITISVSYTTSAPVVLIVGNAD